MKKPSLQLIVAVVEIVASLAVVISLLYAVSEFRRSQTLNSRDVEDIVYQRMLEMDRLLIESPGFADVFVAAATDPDTLSPTDRVRFLAYEHIFYDSWESAWYYHQSGILEEGSWESWNTWFVAEATRRPHFGWTGNRKNFGDDFLAFVDRELPAEPAAADRADE